MRLIALAVVVIALGIAYVIGRELEHERIRRLFP